MPFGSDRWGGPRPGPYKHDAVDSDNDGLVQEGTIWERPGGTRFVSRVGRVVTDAVLQMHPGMYLVDEDGNRVEYTPRRRPAEPSDMGTVLIGDSNLHVDNPIAVQGMQPMATEPVRQHLGTISNPKVAKEPKAPKALKGDVKKIRLFRGRNPRQTPYRDDDDNERSGGWFTDSQWIAQYYAEAEIDEEIVRGSVVYVDVPAEAAEALRTPTLANGREWFLPEELIGDSVEVDEWLKVDDRKTLDSGGYEVPQPILVGHDDSDPGEWVSGKHTLYHGTRFHADSIRDDGSLRISGNGEKGPGVYLTPSEEHAERFATRYNEETREFDVIGETFGFDFDLDEMNILDLTEDDTIFRRAENEAIERGDRRLVSEILKENGYDGLVHQSPGDDQPEYVIFDSVELQRDVDPLGTAVAPRPTEEQTKIMKKWQGKARDYRLAMQQLESGEELTHPEDGEEASQLKELVDSSLTNEIELYRGNLIMNRFMPKEGEGWTVKYESYTESESEAERFSGVFKESVRNHPTSKPVVFHVPPGSVSSLKIDEFQSEKEHIVGHKEMLVERMEVIDGVTHTYLVDQPEVAGRIGEIVEVRETAVPSVTSPLTGEKWVPDEGLEAETGSLQTLMGGQFGKDHPLWDPDKDASDNFQNYLAQTIVRERERAAEGKTNQWDHPGRVITGTPEATAMSLWRSDFSTSSSMRRILNGGEPSPAYDNDRTRGQVADIQSMLENAPELDLDQWRIQISQDEDYPIGHEFDFSGVSAATKRSDAESFASSTDVYGDIVGNDNRVLINFKGDARGVYHDEDTDRPRESIVTGKYRIISSEKETVDGRDVQIVTVAHVGDHDWDNTDSPDSKVSVRDTIPDGLLDFNTDIPMKDIVPEDAEILHVTTNADAIRAEGFKERGGTGFGTDLDGGARGISTTYDSDAAESFQTQMQLAIRAANGDADETEVFEAIFNATNSEITVSEMADHLDIDSYDFEDEWDVDGFVEVFDGDSFELYEALSQAAFDIGTDRIQQSNEQGFDDDEAGPRGLGWSIMPVISDREKLVGIDPEKVEILKLRPKGDAIDADSLTHELRYNAADLELDEVRATTGEQVTSFVDRMEAKYPDAKIDFSGSSSKDSEGNPIATLSRIVVPEDSREAGQGTAFMEDLNEWADANGTTVALTPSSDFGGTVSRLKEFYKRHGYVENTGKNKDYAISDTMYRLPQ